MPEGVITPWLAPAKAGAFLLYKAENCIGMLRFRLILDPLKNLPLLETDTVIRRNRKFLQEIESPGDLRHPAAPFPEQP